MRISSLRWGIILLGIGFTVLAIKFDYVDSYVWHTLFALWPVFIIAIGIELIFRGTRLHYLALLSPLLIAGTFIYAGLTTERNNWGDRWNNRRWFNEDFNRDTKHYSFDKDALLKNLELDIKFGAGEVWLGPTSNALFTADLEYRRNEPSCNLSISGENGKISVKSTELRAFYFWNDNKLKNDARMFVTDSLPLDITLDAAAASADLDLTDLIVNSVRLESGASSVDLRLGCRSNNVSVKINSGASRVMISVPREMGLKFALDAALSSTNLRDLDLVKTKGGYESNNYESAVDSGVSSLEVDYY
jgi:hypothetical protein